MLHNGGYRDENFDPSNPSSKSGKIEKAIELIALLFFDVTLSLLRSAGVKRIRGKVFFCCLSTRFGISGLAPIGCQKVGVLRSA
jgi:hypothetical protein